MTDAVPDVFVASPAAKARCEKELKRPPIAWKNITQDTVTQGHDKKGPGIFFGIEFPWNEAMLHEWGAEWLTKAFHAVGSLSSDNKVKRIITEDKIKVTTGNNGGKFLFEVEYDKPSPDLDTKLFAKVPFPLDGKTKTDRMSSSVNKQPQEYCEINTSRLLEGFMPMKIPKFYFGDISNDTSNWILITECIKYEFREQNYGVPGERLPPLKAFEVEGPYDKCIDKANLRGASVEYYLLLVKKGAMLAGYHKSGKLLMDDAMIGQNFTSTAGVKMTDFPIDQMQKASTGEMFKAIDAKINLGIKFFATAQKVFPDYVTTDAFKQRFRTAMLHLNAYAMEINAWKEASDKDYVALSHVNMNVDNAYFWRDDNGKLDCGVLDWGGFGISSLGHKLWWWLYCQDYEPLQANVDTLLDCFTDTYHAAGGPKLDKTVFKNQFLVTAMQQMIGLISAIPQINRMCKQDAWKTIQDRYDPRIALNIDDKSSLRLYLHCMNSIIRMIQEWDADEALYKGFVQDFYVGQLKQKPKSADVVGAETPKIPEKDSAPSGQQLQVPDAVPDAFVASPAAKARCEIQLKRPPIAWTNITQDTVTQGHEKKAPGMFYDIEFPWNEAMLHEWGAEWLTKAFHAVGSLSPDNKVKRIITEDKIKVTTGNNGGKFLFEVEYEKPSPDLDTKLFAKVPFPLDGKTKTDRMSSSVNKQPQEYCEINTSRLLEGFMPMKIPKFYFGDISNNTSNWILITECIKYEFREPNYGPPGERLPPLAAFEVEGPYDKCIDAANLRGDSIEYYLLLVAKGAMLAGYHKSGKLLMDDEMIGKNFTSTAGLKLTDFPFDQMQAAATGEMLKAIEAKINLGFKFFGTAQAVFPDYVTSDAFQKRFRTAMLHLNAYATEITAWKEAWNKDYVALSHVNMNVDNAYFWRDDSGKLDCGVLDWGGFGISSLGHKLWWWLYCQDYEPLQANVDTLLGCFIDTYHAAGGPKLDKTIFKTQFLVTAMQQMIGLISAIPQINRMVKQDAWTTIEDRYDPRIALNIDDKSSLRLYLHCMNSIIRLIQEHNADEALYKGFVQDFYVGVLKQKPKSADVVGAELPKIPEKEIDLTYDEAYELQDTLIKAYTTPKFQRQLHRAFINAGDDPVAQAKGRQAVCLPYQGPVIAKYGFTPDRKGVAASQKPFMKKFANDEKLGEQSMRLNVLVNPSQDDAFLAEMGIPKGAKDIPMDFEEAYEMQDLFIKAYSTHEFQQELHTKLAGLEKDVGAATLARADVCMPVQAEVVPRFGFVADRKGVSASLKHFRNPELYQHERGQELNEQGNALAYLVNPTMQDKEFIEKMGVKVGEGAAPVAVTKLELKKMDDTEVPVEQASYVEILEQEPVPPVTFLDGEIEEAGTPVDVYKQRGSVLGFLEFDEKYLIATFDGQYVKMGADKLRGFEPPPTENGGFDVVWPGDGDEELEWLGPVACQTLVEKGFFMIQMRNSDEDRANVKQPVQDLNKWTRFPADIEQAYLGRGMSDQDQKVYQKVHWLPPDDMSTPTDELEDGLQRYDRTLTDLAAAIGPVTQEALGFSGFGRSAAFVRKDLDTKNDDVKGITASMAGIPAAYIWNQDGLSSRVQSWFGFLQYRRLCMMSFVSGSFGTMALHPKEGSGFDKEVLIPVEPNRTVVFRHDLFSYTFLPDGEFLALQAWVLSEPHQHVISRFPTENGIVALDRPAPPYGKTGRTVGVMSIDCNIPGNSIGIEAYWALFQSGADASYPNSQTRWDHLAYYAPDNHIPFVNYYPNHSSVIGDQIFDFDNVLFGLTEEESEVMDPLMRKGLEVGYGTLVKAGFVRKTMNGQQMGTFLGSCPSDYSAMPYLVSERHAQYVRCAKGHCFGAARLPYYLNIVGNVCQVDTACSSSLVSIFNAFSSLRPQEQGAIQSRVGSKPTWAISLGTNALIGPVSWVGLCGPHMVSGKGRCFTFDSTADGFGRGEGFSGITLRDNALQEEPTDRFAMICGAACNQDGRSASMTAPHGPSQQECLWNSFREADILPADVRIAELHGTGTALGDPIEVGALRGVLRKRTDPVYKTSSKCNLCHGEANAGIAGFIKCTLMTVYSVCSPNIHLLELNPNMDTNSYPVLFAPEGSAAGGNSGYCGVSSFGFGGTNGRADVWARALVGPYQTGGAYIFEKLAFIRAKQMDLEDRVRAFEDPDVSEDLKKKTYSSVLADELRKAIDTPDGR